MRTQNEKLPLQDTVRTRHETATLLRLSIRTLDYLIARREIGFCKVGAKLLFRPSDIESFLTRHAITPRDNSEEIE
ncbi:MAG: helix-turn-helix domain-containing protein [Terrimicrobiaceae bacterium]